jgi:predicted DNA-binding transcriptional regulator YafY
VPPFLDAVQQAVVDGVQVVIDYVARDRSPSSRVVHPLGVAAKGSAWYLVADTDAGLRTFRVDRMTSVVPTADRVVRPEGFDLARAWALITDEIDERRTPVRARALVDPGAVWLCRSMLGSRLRVGPSAPDGRVEVELRGHSTRALAGELAGLGAMVEVLEPTEMRDQLAAIGAELTRRYGEGAVARSG